jgi:transcriptional regulator with XRE-family HTH domain
MLSVVKTDEQRLARELRAQGWSIKEIEHRLGVSRSSVSLWVRDVVLGPAERRRLIASARLGPLVSAERKSNAARTQRRGYQDEGQRLLHQRDASYLAGCMLYWAEGAKERNAVKIVNSDPELLSTFARFLGRHFEVAAESMIIRCNLFADHLARQREVEAHWLTTLGLPTESLRRSTVNVYSKYSLKKRVGKLPYGTCELRVYSTQIVQTIYGSIQEYGGFERAAWLD